MNTLNNNENYIEVSCIQVKQPVGVFYVASIGYKDLLEISYADIRHLETNSTELEKYIGIQRLLSKNRVKEIASYVQLVDATFPTGIIVEISQFENVGDSAICNINYDESSGKLMIRRNNNVAKILDGQHRLAGLREGGLDLNNEDFTLNVTIFVDMDIEDQAIIFATINKSHTKVNKSLVADLFEYTKTRSPQKTAHNIARALDQKEGSPFFGKIKILGVATDRFETITQATFVDSLIRYISGNNICAMKDRDIYKRDSIPNKVNGDDEKKLFLRNMFIEEEDANIAQILWNYFFAVQQKWPTAWNDVQQNMILNKSTGFIALMRFLKDAYLSFDKVGDIVTKEEFLEIFNRIDLQDDDFNRDRYAPGGTGPSALYRELKEKSGL
ncbi:MAG: DGQHR domain-containing protein [Parcubacteria group bacterium]|jgi:DGQHR domain-containing protein